MIFVNKIKSKIIALFYVIYMCLVKLGYLT